MKLFKGYQIKYLLIISITLWCFIPLISYSTEISELEEITMQVIEMESVDNIDIQQMIEIPAPVSRDTISHGNTEAANIMQNRSNINNREQLKSSNENHK